MYLILMLALPVLLQAQYMGGGGRSDIKVSLTNITIPVQEISAELPTKYDLAQNYPNPFNPVTAIRYAILRNGYVRLIVFDALGKEIETLVNEKQTAGTYEATWNASQFPSGVYFCKLQSVDFTDTQKLIPLK